MPTYFKDIKLETEPIVYDPSDDSFLLAEVVYALQDLSGKDVLDVGTGSGILAIAAAKKGANVTAVDVNPRALIIAERNAKANGVHIEFKESDLFSSINKKFDLITFNPPYVPTEESETKDVESKAWDGGADGNATIDRFLSGFKEHLKKDGRALLLVSSLNNKKIKNSNVLSSKKLFFEELFVLEIGF